ncbi:MAG: FAD-dependent oxidoreductase [Saprospiraceae bacterium]
MDLRSGLPFWLIKNGLPYSYPQLDHAIDTDVVILGGGISGALMGYYLVNAGIDCVIIDSRTIGLGSTCASTALLQYEIDVSLTELTDKIGHSKAAKAYLLGVESIDLLHRICGDMGFEEFEFKNSLYYAVHKKDIAWLKKEYEARKQIGIDLEYLEAGTFGSTKDGLPFIGPYTKLPRSYFALGFGGNGITFSVIAAKMITEMILENQRSDTVIFGFDRLEK